MHFRKYTILSDRYKDCRTCLEDCPEQAISRTEAEYCVIDEVHCSYCGVCEDVCQVQAVKKVFSCRALLRSFRYSR